MSRVSNLNAEQSKPIATRAPIRALLTPRYKDMGGLSVLRSLPTSEVTTIGPWIYFDHLGPATFSAGCGHIHCAGTSVPAQSMAVFNGAHALSTCAHEYSRIVLIGGAHLGPRIIDWNYVSSSPTRIEQAKEKWRQGLFPKVPGDEEEFIPLP